MQYFTQFVDGYGDDDKAAEFIRPAILGHLADKPQRWNEQILYVSEFGRHPANAMLRMLDGKQWKPDPNLKLTMSNGTAFENGTFDLLRNSGELPSIFQQFPLYDDIWHGRADMVIGHGTMEVVIVEHKATSDASFDYGNSYPRAADLCQLWLYGELYHALFKIKPKLVLFYRSWKRVAECHIHLDEDTRTVRPHLWIDGRRVEQRVKDVWPPLLRDEMETLYRSQSFGEDLPESLSSWDYAEEATARMKQSEVTF